MLIIPAIDLLGGRAVRLEQGDFARVTDFGPDPIELARRFAGEGAPWLHVVDLDGARSGHWCHLDVIAEIVASAGVPVQAGGGARDLAQVEAALERGVARVIVGTATESPAIAASWAARFGPRLVFSLDTRDRRILTQGWRIQSADDPVALAETLRDAGARRFIHTDTVRDGMLRGPDLSGLSALLPLGVPVLVAGGVATYADLEAIRDAGAEGAIVGRALLEGKIELAPALTIAKRKGA